MIEITYLEYHGTIRGETDPAVIGNLTRKGWVQLPPRPSEDAQWHGNAGWVVPPPPPPEPDWGRFKSTLLLDPAANAALASAMVSAPGAALALPAALMGLAAGQPPADFQAAWGALRGAGLVPPELLATISSLAQDCDLPGAFTQSLRESQPPFAESVGQEWLAPDGSLWRVVQPRGEDGQFLPDDPATPERESLVWQRIS